MFFLNSPEACDVVENKKVIARLQQSRYDEVLNKPIEAKEKMKGNHTTVKRVHSCSKKTKDDSFKQMMKPKKCNISSVS